MVSNDNWFGIEPLKDANGKIIPLDTEVLYDKYENVFHVVDFCYSPNGKEWIASGGFTEPKDSWRFETNRLILAAPDSWDKLIGDLNRAANGMSTDEAECRYADNVGKPCCSCKFGDWSECKTGIFTNIAYRINKLREKEQ